MSGISYLLDLVDLPCGGGFINRRLSLCSVGGRPSAWPGFSEEDPGCYEAQLGNSELHGSFKGLQLCPFQGVGPQAVMPRPKTVTRVRCSVVDEQGAPNHHWCSPYCFVWRIGSACHTVMFWYACPEGN